MDRTLSSTPSAYPSIPCAGLRPWLRPIALLLLVTVHAVSMAFSWGGQAQGLLAQEAATPQMSVANRNMTTATIPTHSVKEVSAAVHSAESLVLDLWQATPNPEAPIESLEWLIAHFKQGWAPDMARQLASYYSYSDGTHHYLRFTDDVLPPLLMATTVTVTGLDAKTAAVNAEFPAIDGPVQFPASSRLYLLIKESGTWKIESVTLPGTPSVKPRTDV